MLSNTVWYSHVDTNTSIRNKSKSANKVKALRTTNENGGPRTRETVISWCGSAQFRLCPYIFDHFQFKLLFWLLFICCYYYYQDSDHTFVITKSQSGSFIYRYLSIKIGAVKIILHQQVYHNILKCFWNGKFFSPRYMLIFVVPAWRRNVGVWTTRVHDACTGVGLESTDVLG
jgi:hypothetical protein